MDENIDSMSIEAAYARYLMSSYLYYNDHPVLPYSDSQFDGLCKRLLDEWDTFSHQHKHLCTEDDLRAGTGYAIKFPNIVKGAALSWVDSFKKENK